MKPWGKQKDVLNALATERRVSVASGHDVGKTWVAAGACLWYLFSHPNSKVITTSNSFQQTRTVLWSEIRTFHKRLKERITDAGEMLQTELRIDTNWFAIGVNTETPDAFQGKHSASGNQLVIVDEACGIPYDMFYAIEAIATSSGNKILLIGNPTDPNSYFGDTHSGKIKGWKCISISCYDSPNLQLGPDGKFRDKIPLPYPALVSMQWIEEKKGQWGTRSPQYVSRVLGQFPESAEDQLVAGRYISRAIAKGVLLRKLHKQLSEGDRVLNPEDVEKLRNKAEEVTDAVT